MSWIVITLGVAFTIVVIGGAALAFYRRYGSNCKWSTRNIWSVCEEWRQRLSWLWAPREEKVGLVKAQHPTAQTIPGLYRQSSSNTHQSHHLLHSDSDLRLDAQGAFTRFEAVDKDLHPPMGGVGVNTTMIPPQPLRPAPQPKPTPRPRPSPLQTHNTPEYLRMQDSGPGPLTPPPIPRPGITHHRNNKNDRNDKNNRNGPPSVFIFQNEIPKIYNQYSGKQVTPSPPSSTNNQPSLNNYNLHTKSVPESIQTNGCYSVNNQSNDGKFNFESHCDTNYHLCRINRETPYRPYDLIEDTAKLKYGVSTSQLNEHSIQKQNSDNLQSISSHYDDYNKTIQQQQQQQQSRQQHLRNDSRGSFNSFNFSNSNSTTQSIIESIYGSEAITKLLKNSQIYSNQLGKKNEIRQNIEMTAFRNSSNENIFPDDINYSMEKIHGNSKIQGLERVSQYIQSLPDVPNYDSLSDQTHDDLTTEDERESVFTSCDNDTPSPIPPPPPAPPDPSNYDSHRNKPTSSPTTGERIFSALRSVTSQSYIDASEFYNSVLSSAQQVPMLTFPNEIRRSSLQLEKTDTVNGIQQDEVSNLYIDSEPAAIGIDCSRRTSDLYSPELNLEAHRTAQEVYNSLQDPPSSPLLLKDLSQESYPYMSDPSFTRTSEDIFNSLEQRRKSMERLNGFHEYVEMEQGIDNVRRRSSSQDLYNALEEVKLQRRLSQQLIEDSYGYSNSNSSIDIEEVLSLNGRRSSQGPEPEPPPPDETNLKRAISCESVCSDTSVILGDIEEVTVVGLICVGLEYERWGGRGADIEGDLVVSVLEARDLIAPDGRPAQDTLARVCLLPDRQTHVQTRLYRGSPSPSYQEKFLFPLDGGPIGRTLLVEIFSIETNMGGGAFLIGEASLKLGPAARPPATTWLPLVSPIQPVPHLGELMFSLSYLPTAERLTLVVVKARNLNTNNTVPGDLFVKVYLLQQGKKIHKKKTSAKRGEKSPTFNEAMIFNVPAHTLQTIQLRLTVAELNSDTTTNSKAYSIGHVIIGSNATGKSLTHWRQMLAALRRPVVMWHPLRK